MAEQIQTVAVLYKGKACRLKTGREEKAKEILPGHPFMEELQQIRHRGCSFVTFEKGGKTRWA